MHLVSSLDALAVPLLEVVSGHAGLTDRAGLAKLAVIEVAALAGSFDLVEEVPLLARVALVGGTMVTLVPAALAGVFLHEVAGFAVEAGDNPGGGITLAVVAVGEGLLAGVAGALAEVEPVLAAGAFEVGVDGVAVGDFDGGADVLFGVDVPAGLTKDTLFGALDAELAVLRTRLAPVVHLAEAGLADGAGHHFHGLDVVVLLPADDAVGDVARLTDLDPRGRGLSHVVAFEAGVALAVEAAAGAAPLFALADLH